MTRTTSLACMLTIVGLAAGAAPAVAQDMACQVRGTTAEAAERPSPLDSVMFAVDGHPVKVCYGRPSARGRTMIGGALVPFDQLWRTGANEPTVIHTHGPLSVAGVTVPAGTVSLYTVPGESEWEIILNASTSQWGAEGQYTPEVAAQEIGRGTAPSGAPDEYVETFTIAYADGHLVLAWENTLVRVPVEAAQ